MCSADVFHSSVLDEGFFPGPDLGQSLVYLELTQVVDSYDKLLHLKKLVRKQAAEEELRRLR